MSISWDDLIRDAGDAITSFEPLPDGDYDLEVIELKPEMTKDGSKKKFNLKAKIVGGPHANRFIWDNIVLTTDNPNALGFFFKKMAGIGLTIDFFKTKPADEQIAATAKGRRFRAKIGSRIWNGEKKNEIKNYYPQAAGAQAQQPPGMTGAVTPPPMAAPPAPAAAPPPSAPIPAPTQVQAPAPTEAPAPQFAPVQQQDPWTGQPAYQQPQPTAQGYPQPPAEGYAPPPAPTPEQPAQQQYQEPAAGAPQPPPVAPEAAPQYSPPAPQAQEGGPAAPPPPPAPPF